MAAFFFGFEAEPLVARFDPTKRFASLGDTKTVAPAGVLSPLTMHPFVIVISSVFSGGLFLLLGMIKI